MTPEARSARITRPVELLEKVGRRVPLVRKRFELKDKIVAAQALWEEAYTNLGGEDRAEVTQDQVRLVLDAERALVVLGESSLSNIGLTYLERDSLGIPGSASQFLGERAKDFENLARNIKVDNDEKRKRRIEFGGRARACRNAAGS